MTEPDKQRDAAPVCVVVAGYPKSGNTWLTRLVADLLDCPARGFLTPVNHVDNACEGEARDDSKFVCFKSHHQWHELRGEQLIDDNTVVIYVLRDPRDVAVSAANFFRLVPRGLLGRMLQPIPRATALYGAAGKKLLSEQTRIRRTVRAVLEGSALVHHWCRVSWQAHVRPFADNNCLMIRYEDLLADAVVECRRIVDAMQVDRSDAEIAEAVNRQSFANRKSEFENNGQHKKARFLRSGRREQWRDKLTTQQLREFDSLLSLELKEFGYPPAFDPARATTSQTT